MDLAKECGSSSWLSVLPLDDQDFLLHKGDFRDALCLRYGWTLPNTPWLYNCGNAFSSDHAMVCHIGGFPTIHHNQIRDITASLLTEVCSNVATEPHLQPLSGQDMRFASTITDDGAHLDIYVRGFLNNHQDAFLDVRVFHPNSPSNHPGRLSTMYKGHEDEKKRAYGQRIHDIEHGVFTPIVFSTTGSMGREGQTFYKYLANKLASKCSVDYCTLLGWLRCKYPLPSSDLGEQIFQAHPIKDAHIALACSEGCVPPEH